MTIILILLGIFGIYIIMVIACGGFAMKRCFGHDWINNLKDLLTKNWMKSLFKFLINFIKLIS